MGVRGDRAGLVDRPLPPSHAEAMAVLSERGIPFARVVEVRPYAITIETDEGCVLTAWLQRTKDRLLIWTEPGLPTHPFKTWD